LEEHEDDRCPGVQNDTHAADRAVIETLLGRRANGYYGEERSNVSQKLRGGRYLVPLNSPPRRAARVIRRYAQVRLAQNADCVSVSSVLCSTLYLFCFAIVT
jgi:hypothetical protein